ncbi:MAG: signal peptide peptidase SppA [Pseudomonadota bacterium]|nr:signal peptide peptidase SppA [Pseudomonadota bacterium]
MNQNPSLIRRVVRRAGWIIDGLRRWLSRLMFVGFVLVVVVLLRTDLAIQVPNNAALVLKLQGVLVEQSQQDPFQKAVDEALGAPVRETRVRDLVRALNQAADDLRIKTVVLDFSHFEGGELSKLVQIADALQRFKTSGKPVYAYADQYTQSAYLLAAQASEIHMHPMGQVGIEGFSTYPFYFRDLIDKIGLDVNVFRVGEFKSAVEPFIRNDMSESAREANRVWLEDLWEVYKQAVASARSVNPDAIQSYADQLAERLVQTAGDGAQLALQEKLVDALSHRDEFIGRVRGTADPDEFDGFKSIDQNAYLLAVGEQPPSHRGKPTVGILVASGAIVEGDAALGAVSGDAFADQIRQARLDDAVKAVVVRIDSPGGSAFASEVIRRELDLTRQSGKPVVVSMGSVAASGGYWIATAADRILASPATLTGSIGVFGILPTYQDTLAKLGVHVDGVGTTALAGALRADRKLNPAVGQAIQAMVERTYQDFLLRVADARDLPVETVATLAEGRVWSGSDAVRLQLVDGFGEIDEAVTAAAELANLGGNYQSRYLEPDLTLSEYILGRMQGVSVLTRGLVAVLPPELGPIVQGWLKTAGQPAGRAQSGIYAFCLCGRPGYN